MRRSLTDFIDQRFDVAVIGGGINGTAVARDLAIAGYSVALIEKADFGGGATSRSSRFAHCGLNYLAPQTSILDHLRHPLRFLGNLRMARSMLADRGALVAHHPRHVQRFRACLPVYADGAFAPWQVRLAFAFLTLPRLHHPLLNHQWLGGSSAAAHPFAPLLASARRLEGIVAFDEFQFVWPERLCIDAAIAAERHGVVVRNYTAVESLRPLSRDGWEIELVDMISAQSRGRMRARFVINTAGPWADEVLASAADDVPRCLTLTKGAHVLVRLPPACRGQGLVTLAADGHFFTAAPCGEFHYLGPTETPHDGDPTQARATEDDIARLLALANDALPGADLRRSNVLAAWAGVRPVTHSAQSATGRHEREIHDRSDHGVADMLTLSWGRLVDHRQTARALVHQLRGRLAPSRARRPESASDRANLSIEPAPSLDDALDAANIESIAVREHVVHLDDILFRRSSAGWRPTLDRASMRAAAAAAAGVLGWDASRVDAELARCEAHRRNVLGIAADAVNEPMNPRPR